MMKNYEQKVLNVILTIKKNHTRLIISLIALFTLIFIFSTSISTQLFTKNTFKKSEKLSTPSSQHRKPIILHWTQFFHNKPLTEFIRHFPKCKYECIYTNDRAFVDHAQSIVFHIRQTNLSDLPPNRQDQLRVFFSREGPYQTWFRADGLLQPDYFNLTINYRSDSNIPLKYGYFQLLNEDEKQRSNDNVIDRQIANKTKIAFSAISHCQTYSRREFYLNELYRYINITSIGKCKSNQEQECADEYCLKAISADHFFYFAFENAVCPEYLTEKFFRLYEIVVPVVLTRSIMPNHIPPTSYVAASDFESPRKLAEYLIKVASNQTEYKKFFEWTHTYRKLDYEFWLPDRQCRLCEMLYKKKRARTKDFTKFMDNSICSNGFAEKLLSSNRTKVFEEEKRLRDIMRDISL